jgi:hypothetical protein
MVFQRAINWRSNVLAVAIGAGIGGSVIADTRFAVIGDFGNGVAEQAVANRLKTFNPEFIISVGDQIYKSPGGGTTAEFNTSVGNIYGSFIRNPANPSVLTAVTNNFYPTIGNHDIPVVNGYVNYFDLTHANDPAIGTSSGSERYYDVVRGNLHFFMMSSDPQDTVSGQAVGSPQRTWFEGANGNGGVLAASTSVWNIPVFHHPPYATTDTPASGDGSNAYMQWGFSAGGNKAPLIYTGHTHNYDRTIANGQQYVIEGSGGRPLDPFFPNPGPFTGTAPAPQTAYRNDQNNGLSIVDSNELYLTSKHFEQNGNLTDKFTLLAPGAPALQSRSFRQNVGGYAGTHDVELREDGAAVSPAATTVKVSADDNAAAAGGQRTQELILFDDLLGYRGNQVPLGVKVTSAVLKLNVTDAGSGFEIHRMLAKWDEATATWDGFGGGVKTDGVQAAAAFEQTVGLGDGNATPTTNVGAGLFTLDVTRSVQAWADGAANNGWLLTGLTNGVNTIAFASAEDALAPELDVEFINVPEPGSATVLVLGAIAVRSLRIGRRQGR